MEDLFSPWFGYGGEDNMAVSGEGERISKTDWQKMSGTGEQETARADERNVTEKDSQDNQDQQNQSESGSSNSGPARSAQKSAAQKTKDEDERIRENGQVTLGGEKKGRIHLLSIIGEIEGHENLSGSTKTTKYEHILPKLAEVEDDKEIKGVLVLINTVGGDVSSGLALAEMIASLSKPTVSLVIGDSHSIGVPLAVATDYSFIVPTGTMMVHPVRMTGMVIGAVQTYEYFEMIQDRILSFVSNHSGISYEDLKGLMLNTKMLTKDLGTVLVGKDAVDQKLINEVGGIRDALNKLYDMIEKQ